MDVDLPPEAGPPDTLAVYLSPWAGGEDRPLGSPVARREGGATFRIPEDASLDPGSYTIWATADWSDGAIESVSMAVAVREPSEPAPLEGGQWVQLDFEADRDGDDLPDFPADLMAFGLAGGLSTSVDLRIEAWVIDEITRRTRVHYDVNPSGLPGGDPLPLVFSAQPPSEGPYTRICVAGASPAEEPIIGNVLLDPGNRDRSDEACDDFLPSGVFPRELLYYEDDPAFLAAFGPLLGRPAGADPLDPIVVSEGYDASDPAQAARRQVLERAVAGFSQAVASVVAHEAAHAMGLVPPGSPGEGLYGGEDGSAFTHNLTPLGDVPDENHLMNPGPTFSFDDLAGTDGPLTLRPLNFAYLHGRVLLDARIDAVRPPPLLAGVTPSRIETGSSLLATLEIEGRGLSTAPTLILRGPTDFLVTHAATITGRDGEPDRVLGNVLAPTLVPGSYDVELTNPDGQRDTLTRALEVR